MDRRRGLRRRASGAHQRMVNHGGDRRKMKGIVSCGHSEPAESEVEENKDCVLRGVAEVADRWPAHACDVGRLLATTISQNSGFSQNTLPIFNRTCGLRGRVARWLHTNNRKPQMSGQVRRDKIGNPTPGFASDVFVGHSVATNLDQVVATSAR